MSDYFNIDREGLIAGAPQSLNTLVDNIGTAFDSGLSTATSTAMVVVSDTISTAVRTHVDNSFIDLIDGLVTRSSAAYNFNSELIASAESGAISTAISLAISTALL